MLASEDVAALLLKGYCCTSFHTCKGHIAIISILPSLLHCDLCCACGVVMSGSLLSQSCSEAWLPYQTLGMCIMHSSRQSRRIGHITTRLRPEILLRS